MSSSNNFFYFNNYEGIFQQICKVLHIPYSNSNDESANETVDSNNDNHRKTSDVSNSIQELGSLSKVEPFYLSKMNEFVCYTHNLFLLKIIEEAVQKKNAPSNRWRRDWNWFSFLGMSEFALYNYINSTLKYPNSMKSADRFQHIVLDLADGGKTCINLYYPERSVLDYNINELTPVLIFCPSLVSNQDHWVNVVQSYVNKHGWIVAVTNRRGLCEKLSTPTFHVMGNDEDLKFMIEHLQKIDILKNRPMFALGISMGGNWLTRYLGKYDAVKNEDCTRIFSDMPNRADGILAAATICSPMNLSDIVVQNVPLLEDTMLKEVKKAYLYDNMSVFLNNSEHDKHSKIKKIYKQLDESKTLTDFSYYHMQLLYSNLNQNETFNSSNSNNNNNNSDNDLKNMASTQLHEDFLYWNCYSNYDAAKFIRKIRIPLLAITADDDPVVYPSTITSQMYMKSNTAVHLKTTCGNHCMFRDDVRSMSTEESWAEFIVSEYFQSLLKQYYLEKNRNCAK